MWYKAKNMNLEEFISEKRKEYLGLPTYRWDEGLVWAVQEYYGSMGEFSEEDWKYIKENDLEEIAYDCEENM